MTGSVPLKEQRESSALSLCDLSLFFLSLSRSCEYTRRKRPSTGQEDSFHQEPFLLDLDLGLPASRVRNRCLHSGSAPVHSSLR